MKDIQRKVVVEFFRDKDGTAVFELKVKGSKEKLILRNGAHEMVQKLYSVWHSVNCAYSESAGAALRRMEAV